jgi:hypothetical protein
MCATRFDPAESSIESIPELQVDVSGSDCPLACGILVPFQETPHAYLIDLPNAQRLSFGHLLRSGVLVH